jgi:hypothetical protein
MQNPGNNKKQTFNMFKSLTLVAFVACALVAVRADGDEDFGCDLCTAVITDFTPELKTGVLEGVSSFKIRINMGSDLAF